MTTKTNWTDEERKYLSYSVNTPCQWCVNHADDGGLLTDGNRCWESWWWPGRDNVGEDVILQKRDCLFFKSVEECFIGSI